MKQLFKHVNLGPRLGIGFGLVLLVMAAAASVGIWRLDSLQDIADDLGGASSERALLARELHAIVVLSSFRAETLLQNDDTEFAARINTDRKQTSQRSDTIRKRLEQLADTDKTKELFNRIDQSGDKFREVRNALVKRKDAGEKIPADDINRQLRPAAADYADAVNALAEYQQHRVEEAREAAAASGQFGISLLIAGILLGGLLGTAFAYLLTRSIVIPLRGATQLAERVAAGDLTATVSTDGGRDEVQTLVNDLGVMQSRLAGLVHDVQQISSSVTMASTEIATGNQDLSSRTEQTASSLQQTASSMEQLTGTVKQTADSARTANQLASSASASAAKGGEVVAQVVATMDEINASSKKIADIIGVIDGIAFQTNILALNAAVEAARAGEQGRGFAVVAGEVRSLAQRSAEAAKEIKSLIGASVDRVETGSKLVQDAGSAMTEIVANVKRVNDIIGEITAAASEQSDGIGQVNTAVNQLDQMTQQNAALVEQSAAAAESLKDQAFRLADVVGRFKLSAEAGSTVRMPPPQPTKLAPARPAAAAMKPAPAKPKAAPVVAAAPIAPATVATAKADDDWTSF